jgi:hypothetical protein
MANHIGRNGYGTPADEVGATFAKAKLDGAPMLVLKGTGIVAK